MNWVTLLLAVVIGLFTWRAYRNGFVRELVSLSAVILAVPIAGIFYDDMFPKVQPIVDNRPLASLISFIAILGGVIILSGAFGLLRLRDFYQRIHGPAITVTLGAGCVILASMILFSALQSRPVLHELLISVFILLTSPVVAMLIMRAAVYRDLRNGRRERGAGGTVYGFPPEE